LTSEQIQTIRNRWISLNTPSPRDWQAHESAQAVADIERLVREIQRLQFACDEIARQYARLCNSCERQKARDAKPASAGMEAGGLETPADVVPDAAVPMG
jgi:hypothetical protein